MLGKRDIAWQSASDALNVYLLEEEYTSSTVNLDTQTVVLVINKYVINTVSSNHSHAHA